MSDKEIPQHVPTKVIAEKLACSPQTIGSMVRKGQIPAVKVGTAYRFDPEAVLLALSRTPKKS